MKRFAVVLLSVLLVLLPGCTKPVTESGVQREYGKRNGGEHSGSFEQY